VLDVSDKELSFVAVSAMRNYFKKYKPKVAKKDGVPIETTDFLVPIIFDPSIFESENTR